MSEDSNTVFKPIHFLKKASSFFPSFSLLSIRVVELVVHRTLQQKTIQAD